MFFIGTMSQDFLPSFFRDSNHVDAMFKYYSIFLYGYDFTDTFACAKIFPVSLTPLHQTL